MGLDMYLTAEKYVPNFEPEHNQLAQSLQALATPNKQLFASIESASFRSIGMHVMQWRKANAIHKWFVDNVQDGEDDCKRYFVDKSKFMELKSIVDSVLSTPSTAENLLPTTIGFFFGSQEYDEYYFNDLKDTQQLLNKLFSDETVFDNYDFYYQASW